MGDPRTALLAERFKKHLEVLNARLELLKKLSAPLEAPSSPGSPPIPPASLPGLPFEIRLQIYRYCIPRKQVIEVSHPRFHIGWPYEEVDRSLDLEEAPDFEHGIPGSEDSLHLDGTLGSAVTLGMEETLDSEDSAASLRADAPYSGGGCLDWEGGYWNRNNKNSIFLLSRQISEEALDILYGENIFILHLHGEGEYYLKENFTEANRQRIRYLLLTAQPMGVSYMLERMPDDALWSSILPQLKGLRIVAEQPVKISSDYWAPSLEQQMERWVEWIMPFLQCIGQHMSKESVVQVDIDGQAETRELVKECLPHGYREIRCHYIGDLIFKRGRFSWESGYWDDDGPMNSRDADGDWGSD